MVHLLIYHNQVIVLKDSSVYDISGEGYNGIGEIIPNNVKAKYKDSGNYLELLIKNCMINLLHHLKKNTLMKR